MSDRIYYWLRRVGAPFAFQLVGEDHIEDRGPAIYVANHLGAVGPIATILSMPVRLYPWAIAEMMDLERAPLYLYYDFVLPQLNLKGRIGMAVSHALSRVAVALLKGLDCIPVDRNRGRYFSAFRQSLALLAAGKNLVVFPEDSSKPPDPETRIHPFLGGFLLLCWKYQHLTGRVLPVYPMAISNVRRTIAIGRALFLEQMRDRRQAVRQMCGRLQEEVQRLWRSLHAGPRQERGGRPGGASSRMGPQEAASEGDPKREQGLGGPLAQDRAVADRRRLPP
ncbi:MAG: lysophospholipid acyltransferase family protein [Chloroflexia bacterium]